MTRIAALCFVTCVFALPVQIFAQGETETPFTVDSETAYSDYVQFADGHAQGVCVFYFKSPAPEDKFNRLVVFCQGDSRTGRSYEDEANKRIVWSRPLAEYTSFVRFQTELNASIYGLWVTRADGEVVKVALQYARRNGASKAAGSEPAIGTEYTGK